MTFLKFLKARNKNNLVQLLETPLDKVPDNVGHVFSQAKLGKQDKIDFIPIYWAGQW